MRLMCVCMYNFISDSSVLQKNIASSGPYTLL